MEENLIENGGEVDLFAEYENGKDIDEINAIIENKEGGENGEGVSGEENKPDAAPLSEETSEQAQTVPGGEKTDKPSTDIPTSESAKNDDAAQLKRYLSTVLGCSEEEVLENIKKRNFEIEAEKNGVSDVDLYIKNKINEEEINRLKEAQAFENFKKEYINDITEQVNKIKEKNPDFDMDAMCDNNEFVDMMNMLYQNGKTKSNAVLFAYNAVMFDKRLQDEKNKILQSIKSGKMRPVEGANTSLENANTIDINNITDDMLESLEKRALAGEEITLV